MANDTYACSPKIEVGGLLYFARLTDKIRLFSQGRLHHELHENMGKGLDLATCLYLGVSYDDLRAQIEVGLTDEEALAWARDQGTQRPAHETAWWNSYIRSYGFRDAAAQRLEERKKEAPHTDRDDILTFLDYIDADEGRL